MLTADTITDEQIRELCADCPQCISNARHNLHGGYRTGAVECVEYHLRGHRLPMPSPGYSKKVGRAFGAVNDWTTRDFIELAYAAADQAGATEAELETIVEILNARAKKPCGFGIDGADCYACETTKEPR